jgi:uncharacterized SAM-binding protein YcdF (DUF218 family)
MRRLLNFLLSPGGPPVVFLLFAVWTAVSRSATARRLSVAAAALYLAASTYVVPEALVRVWQPEPAPFDGRGVPGRGTALVVLGGGEERVRGWDGAMTRPERTEAARVLEAARVFHIVSPDWVISSGGGDSAYSDSMPSSIAMSDALIELGVPPDRIRLESTSRDTHDEAVQIAPMLSALHVDRVVLVTSTVHMRRSLGTFRAAGIDALPASAPDPGRFAAWHDRWLPNERGLRLSSELSHELVGLPYYWARGWWRR